VWKQSDGGVSPDEATWLVNEMLLQYWQSECPGSGGGTVPIGAILPYCGDTLPDGYLWCDGSVVSSGEYPELWAVIADVFKIDSIQFFVPSLNSRFIKGESSHPEIEPIGSTGGQEEHTLTIDEIPAHSHGYSRFKQGGAAAMGNGFISCSWDSPQTGQTGGSLPHENQPPYLVLRYIIHAWTVE
jgi:microcystin-dependent protein